MQRAGSHVIWAMLLAACGGASSTAASPSGADPTAGQVEGAVEGEGEVESAWARAERTCREGDDVSCYDAAAWWSGERAAGSAEEAASPDPARAIAALEPACARGAHDACEWMVSLVLGSPDLAASAGLAARLTTVCEGGDPLTCVVLGTLVSDDPARASRAFEAGCAAGSHEGCFRAGELLAGTDRARARELFTRGCEPTELWGCLELGRALLAGSLGARDRAGARRVLGWVCERDQEKARARGDDAPSEACALLSPGDASHREGALRAPSARFARSSPVGDSLASLAHPECGAKAPPVG